MPSFSDDEFCVLRQRSRGQYRAGGQAVFTLTRPPILMAKFDDKKSKLDPAAVIRRIEDAKLIKPDGKVTYQGWFFEDLISMLETSLSFSTPFPDPVKRRLIWDTLMSPAAAKPLTKSSFTRELNIREAEYINRSPAQYVLATSISLLSTLKVAPIRISGGGRIIFLPKLPGRFDRSSLADRFTENLHNPNPKGYIVATVKVGARSPLEAFDNAMDELDYVRGIWNFVASRNTREIFLNGLTRPINPFCLGQVHTLHEATGKLVAESYWYNQYFVHHDPMGSVSKWGTVKASEKKIRHAVKPSRYPSDLRTIFVKYARALDGVDYEVVFTKLWSLLEFLTHCEDGKYDLLIRRCKFLFKEPEFQGQILEHLRQRRNSFVHAATETVLAKSLVFQLKHYVDQMIMFHLKNSLRFRNREDAAGFLDLPYDPEVIRQRIRRLKMGHRFRSPGAQRHSGRSSVSPTKADNRKAEENDGNH